MRYPDDLPTRMKDLLLIRQAQKQIQFPALRAAIVPGLSSADHEALSSESADFLDI
jgi:hypothetical protein